MTFLTPEMPLSPLATPHVLLDLLLFDGIVEEYDAIDHSNPHGPAEHAAISLNLHGDERSRWYFRRILDGTGSEPSEGSWINQPPNPFISSSLTTRVCERTLELFPESQLRLQRHSSGMWLASFGYKGFGFTVSEESLGSATAASSLWLLCYWLHFFASSGIPEPLHMHSHRLKDMPISVDISGVLRTPGYGHGDEGKEVLIYSPTQFSPSNYYGDIIQRG